MATPRAAEGNTASTPRKRTSTLAKAKTTEPKTEAAEASATNQTPASPEAKTETAGTSKKRPPRIAKKAPAETQVSEVNFSEQVSRLAYRYWEERGCPEGSPHEDWFRAERELSRA